jgi:hypothetical protein
MRSIECTARRRLPIAWLLTLLLTAVAAPGQAAGWRLGGVLPVEDGLVGRWSYSGAWVLPVGDACVESGEAEPAYAVNRGLERRQDGSISHQGADLCNRRAGGVVRAAANGVVARSASAPDGYGVYVVLAHRLESGEAYTVYAHLAPGSVRVREGEVVAAAEPIGRVGRSGNASTDHLHFEVRVPGDLEARWERARIVDPMAFVNARRSCRAADTSWARPFLEWAERAALIPAAAEADVRLSRWRWWSMLIRVARHDIGRLPEDAADLRRALLDLGLIGENPRDADGAPSWKELSRDLARLAGRGFRVPAIDASLLLPALDRLPADGRRGSRPLTLAQACLALAAERGRGAAPAAELTDR